MTTIRLGTGADAVEVESGASVPLATRTDKRGVVVCAEDIGVLLQMPNESVWMEVHAESGEPVREEWVDGIRVRIDLAALRREQPPKHHGAWVIATEREAGRPMLHAAIKGSPIADYWTWRPFNTPEKQAAFDAAMEEWMGHVGDQSESRGHMSPLVRLFQAARALGYGGKR